MATIDVGSRNFTIALTGPESSGKTTLAQWLGELLAVPVVPELARDMLSAGTAYGRIELLEIISAQLALEAEIRRTHSGLLICDTDLLVLQIWWQEKFGELPTELRAARQQLAPRGYLLTQPDLPWQPDPLRENPNDRERLYELYLAELTAGPWPYAIVVGAGDARRQSAMAGLLSLTNA
jgi:nicotinamide riboside kinase